MTYNDVIIWSLCFGLGTVAALVRQKARPPAPSLDWFQVAWSSLYSGFSALTIAIPLRDSGHATPSLTVITAVSVGLMGSEAYNVVRDLLIKMISRALEASLKGGGMDADLGRVGGGAADSATDRGGGARPGTPRGDLP